MGEFLDTEDGRMYRWSKPPVEIARDYFPNAQLDELQSIIWNRTGYPTFWNGPDPETCFREQLYTYAIQVAEGIEPCEFCSSWFPQERGGGLICDRCWAALEDDWK